MKLDLHQELEAINKQIDNHLQTISENLEQEHSKQHQDTIFLINSKPTTSRTVIENTHSLYDFNNMNYQERYDTFIKERAIVEKKRREIKDIIRQEYVLRLKEISEGDIKSGIIKSDSANVIQDEKFS